MKSLTAILIGFLLSLIVMYFLSVDIENGDTNAVIMYFVVFSVPVLIIAVLNGFYLGALKRMTSKRMKTLLSLIPIIILSMLSFNKTLTIPGVDGSLSFAAKIGAIALGLTNLTWIALLKRSQEKLIA